MYKYKLKSKLNNEYRTDIIIGNKIIDVLTEYVNWRGKDLLLGATLDSITIQSNIIVSDLEYTLKSEELKSINDILKTIRLKEPIEKQKLREMKEKCPDDSKDGDPIMGEEWEDIPYKEYILNDTYLSQCYRLSTIINSMNGNLTAKKGDTYFPQWPNDPFTRKVIPPERITELFNDAKALQLDIPKHLEIFVKNLNTKIFDNDIGMSGPYIGLTDKIKPEYNDKFSNPLIELMYGKEELDKIKKQREQEDLLLVQQMSRRNR